MRRLLPPVPAVPRPLVTAVAVAVAVALVGALLVAVPSLLDDRDPDRPGAGTVGADPTCTDALLVLVPGANEAGDGDAAPGPTLSAYAEPLVAGAEAVDRSVTTAVVAAPTRCRPPRCWGAAPAGPPPRRPSRGRRGTRGRPRYRSW